MMGNASPMENAFFIERNFSMKKILIFTVAALFCLTLLAGCKSNAAFVDGTYRAEYDAADGYGYTQYLVVTVENNTVTSIEFDALADDGTRKSKDQDYADQMEAVQGTYPQKYTTDLVNQYLASQDIGQVDTVAGATISSKEFKQLFGALEQNMQNGNETIVYVTR